MNECKSNEMEVIFTNTCIEECKEIYRIGDKFKTKDIPLFNRKEWLYNNQLNKDSTLIVLNIREAKYPSDIIIRFLIE